MKGGDEVRCEVYQEVGQTNVVLTGVVSIEDANNEIKLTFNTDPFEMTIQNNTYYEIVCTPEY